MTQTPTSDKGHIYLDGGFTIIPPQPSLPPLNIRFIIIGGGLCGLTAAYSLARSGHQVTVLEQNDFDDTTDGEACRLPPNMSKIYFRWGLEERVRRIAFKSTVTRFHRYESGEYLGAHNWEEEYLYDTGGDFIFAHTSDLRHLTYQLALEQGVVARAHAEVTSIDLENRAVTLVTGETLSADVLIGADGLYGISRATLRKGEPEPSRRTGVVIYESIIGAKNVKEHPELDELFDLSLLDVLLGNLHGAIAIPLGGEREIGLHIYAPDKLIESEPTLEELKQAAEPIFGRFQTCLDHSTMIKRTPIEERPELKSWVHDTLPLLLIGNAAHPMPPAALQNASLAVEDAGTLGKLFYHLKSPDQIQQFLLTFQDLRQPRCSMIHQREMANAFLIAAPDGPMQQMRDDSMKANTAKGLDIFGGVDDFGSDEWESIRITFSYDPEDDADNWWVNWGVLRERAKEIEEEARAIESKELRLEQAKDTSLAV